MASNSIQRLWLAQATEAPTMSIADIRAKALHFETRTRRWRTVGSAAMILVFIANILEAIFETTLLERLGALLVLAAILYVAHEFRKQARLTSMPEGLGLTSSVDFYRAQLAHERHFTRQSARFLLPFVPGVGLSLMGGVEGAQQIIVAAVFGVALFVGVAWWNAFSARRLQREIDALE